MTILPIRRREFIAVLGTNAADYERAIPTLRRCPSLALVTYRRRKRLRLLWEKFGLSSPDSCARSSGPHAAPACACAPALSGCVSRGDPNSRCPAKSALCVALVHGFAHASNIPSQDAPPRNSR